VSAIETISLPSSSMAFSWLLRTLHTVRLPSRARNWQLLQDTVPVPQAVPCARLEGGDLLCG
jgi:hypothetical protein